MQPLYFIGLMSGTSVDAVDAALISVRDNSITLIDAINTAIPDETRRDILALCNSGADEIQRMKTLDRQLGMLFANAALELLRKTGTSPRNITAIGSHGQTIRHRPDSKPAFTLQIGDPSTIAEITGITTVADFRQRDIAAGGQGAPLLPLFHRNALIKNNDDAVLNLGGIANISLTEQHSDKLIGFDTGPGNVLLDHWIGTSLGKKYDHKGEWAKSGQLSATLLECLLDEDYFSRAQPKSTGRELFNSPWLDRKLDACETNYLSNQDVQCTLVELTAVSVARGIREQISSPGRVIVCGGGVHNQFLLDRIRAHLPKNTCVIPSDDVGIPADWVEAVAFGWFAYNTLNRKASNVPSCTGARGERILGGVYFA
jgi:anhydro-N-acetylmuramic acid kinase